MGRYASTALSGTLRTARWHLGGVWAQKIAPRGCQCVWEEMATRRHNHCSAEAVAAFAAIKVSS